MILNFKYVDDIKRSQFFVDRILVRYYNILIKGFKGEHKFKKLLYFPYYFDFTKICHPSHPKSMFYFSRFRNGNLFVIKRNFYKRLLKFCFVNIDKNKSRYNSRNKRIFKFIVRSNFFCYYSRRKKKEDRARLSNLFMLRKYRKNFFFYFVKHLFDKKYISNLFIFDVVEPVRFLSFSKSLFSSLLFVKYLYSCLKSLRSFLFDLDFVMLFTRIFFFPFTRSVTMFHFVRKCSILANRLFKVFYLCLRLKRLFVFPKYYRRFKFFISNFFSYTKNNIFISTYFSFSKLIFLFFFFKKRFIYYSVRKLNKFFRFLYLCKERLFLRKSQDLLWKLRRNIRRKVLRFNRISFFFIRSTTYNTYYTFLFNSKMLYKKSAGMFEPNRKCRLRYEVMKKMSDDFRSKLELFLIRFPIKKIHLVCGGFRKFQSYMFKGLSIFRDIKTRKYLGALLGYYRVFKRMGRYSLYLNLLRKSVRLKKEIVKFYNLRSFMKEFLQDCLSKKKFLLEILRNKRFLFVLDYIFVVSNQPFNGCRGRRLVTKKKRKK